jgi:cytoskeletal protein CcmA (bactofilin family)
LFAGRRDSGPGPASQDARVDTIVGKDTEFKGTLNSSGLIRIDGKVDGEISHQGDVVIGETGHVTATIRARNVTVAGTVNGNIEATGRLELLASARVLGDLTVTALVISEGAMFKGTSEMKAAEKSPVKPASPPA